jgi:hypothetical protein
MEDVQSEDFKLRKWRSMQAFKKGKSRNLSFQKYNSVDKIDRIVNFEG